MFQLKGRSRQDDADIDIASLGLCIDDGLDMLPSATYLAFTLATTAKYSSLLSLLISLVTRKSNIALLSFACYRDARNPSTDHRAFGYALDVRPNSSTSQGTLGVAAMWCLHPFISSAMGSVDGGGRYVKPL